MSNFSYKDAKGKLVQVPVRFGDLNRQVAAIINKNSENIMASAPFIACYISDIQYDRSRLQDPTFVSKMTIRERAVDASGQEYLNVQGENYTLERVMPSPFTVTFTADIWATNLDQKLQIWEQIVVLFNPAFEIQTTDNYVDWTSLSYVELSTMKFETRMIPQGIDSDISICQLGFVSPIWITPPAKVKKLGIVTKIINNIFESSTDIRDGLESPFNSVGDLFAGQVAKETVVVTPGDYELLVLDNTATLIPIKKTTRNTPVEQIGDVADKVTWNKLLNLYPGIFIAGVSQLRLTKPDNTEIVAFISLNPLDETKMNLNIDSDTIPANTIISGRGTVDAIINPRTYNPGTPAAGTRFLILEDIIDDTDAWGNYTGSPPKENDIIEFDGADWNIVFDASQSTTTTYITNSYTGVQYKWANESWSKSFEGIYTQGTWRLVL